MTEYTGKQEVDSSPLKLALHYISLTYLSLEAIISTHSSSETAEGVLSGMRKLKLFGRDYQVQ